MAHNKSNRLTQIVLAVSMACTLVSNAIADVLDIKSDAPQTYVVKKGDTLWDISNLFLDKPWMWPELWRNNTQIENPHLIYPGDVLRLRYENGVPVLEVVREKASLVMTPDISMRNKPSPISVLPWADIGPFMRDDLILSPEEYLKLPAVYGDKTGSPRFVQEDFLFTENLNAGNEDYVIVRRQREIVDSLGNALGFQVDKIGTVKLRLRTADNHQIVEVMHSDSEARQGDKIMPMYETDRSDLRLQPADRQRGELVENLNGNKLIAKRDVVIINIGGRQVKPGTMFGIYQKGVDIEVGEEPMYSGQKSTLSKLISFSETVKQPAYKVGELVVIKTFDEASYAYITDAKEHLTGGEIIATP